MGGMNRPYDIVVFGATGFTGQLTAEYLARKMGQELRPFTWAIAGRDAAKLAAVKETLIRLNPACAAVDTLIADAADLVSLRDMARLTQVVLTTVGPYSQFGELLVQACLRSHTDYVDITGEPDFVNRLHQRYGTLARKVGVRLVNCCGFDSIPHDLGAYFTAKQLCAEAQPLTLRGFVQVDATFSGGTWQTAVSAFSHTSLAEIGRSATATPTPGRRVRGEFGSVYYEAAVDAWVCPFPTIDPQIVLRSARALPQFGLDFCYGHYLRTESLPKLALGIAGLGAIFALAKLPPTRRLLQSYRGSGAGPDAAQRAASSFSVIFVGRVGNTTIKTEVCGGDPGYDETAKMVAESALCLALERARLPDEVGILTPAVALGDVLLERLQAAGITFRILADES